MIQVCLEVPEHYFPKAEYAIRNLLYILRRKMEVVPRSEFSSRGGGIYYGTNAAEAREGLKNKGSDSGIVFLQASEAALSYFEKHRPYDHQSAVFTDGIRESRIPVLFHTGTVTETEYPVNADSQSGYVNNILYDDIIASAFFFLSDWQNGLAGDADIHGRFRYAESVQRKLGIGDCPVVNEYALLLSSLMNRAGISSSMMNWNGAGFALALTFDIDRIRKKSKGTWARETVDFLLLNKNRKSFPERLDRWQSSVLDLLTPGDTYQDSMLKLVRFSEKNGIKPTFFLQSGIEKHPNDSENYLGYPFFNQLTDSIAGVGGEIGYHPGYEAGYNADLFAAGLHQLEKKIGDRVCSVRFHYLRYDAEQMAGILTEHSIEQDSTLAWAEQAGPRTGCVSPHTLFDRNNNKDTAVLEIPMLAMDAQLFNYMKLNISEAIDLLRKQVDLVERYNGVIVWDYHHQVYDEIEAPGWSRLFRESLNYAIEKEPYNETFKSIARTWFGL